MVTIALPNKSNRKGSNKTQNQFPKILAFYKALNTLFAPIVTLCSWQQLNNFQEMAVQFQPKKSSLVSIIYEIENKL